MELLGSQGFLSCKPRADFLPKAHRLPPLERQGLEDSGPGRLSGRMVSSKWRLCLGSQTQLLLHPSQFPVSHGKRKVPEDNCRLGPQGSEWREFEVSLCGSGSFAVCARQEGPSSCVIFSVSQGSLCKGNFSPPARHRGHPGTTALGKVGRKENDCQCICSCLVVAPLLSGILPQPPQTPLPLPPEPGSACALPDAQTTGSLSCLSSYPVGHSFFFIKTDIAVLQGMK